MGDANSDSGTDLDTSIDQLSDTFLQMNLGNDLELLLHYQMLAFVYNKNYLKRVHHIWIWQEFLVRYPEVSLTSMELKLEFCLRVMSKIDSYQFLSQVHKTYFKSRVFNQNADELLRNCDLEHGVDFVSVAEFPRVLPFDIQKHVMNFQNTKLFEKECQTGPIPIKNHSGETVKEVKDRSLTELLASVFFEGSDEPNLISLDMIKARIKDGFRQKLDFNEYLSEHFRKQEESHVTPDAPSALVETVNQNKSTSMANITPEQPEMHHVSFLDQSKGPNFHGAISSTPVTSQITRVTRASSQPPGRSMSREVERNPKRATSADRSKENLKNFTERLKARSKQRNLRL